MDFVFCIRLIFIWRRIFCNTYIQVLKSNEEIRFSAPLFNWNRLFYVIDFLYNRLFGNYSCYLQRNFLKIYLLCL